MAKRTVSAGDPTQIVHHNDITTYGDAEHDWDEATGTGDHKTITPDADSTRDIGETSTPKRFANVYTDSIGDSGQVLTVKGTLTLSGAIDIDMGTTGNRIDLDTDNDTSIRASADDKITFESSGKDITDFWNSSSDNFIDHRIPSVNGNAYIRFMDESTVQQFRFHYDDTNARLSVWSTDSDGGGTDADIIRIDQGGVDIDGNGNFNDAAFDYVCDDCDWHGRVGVNGVCPECGGSIHWQDDVETMRILLAAMDEKDLDTIKRFGHGAIKTKDDMVWMSLQKCDLFSFSAHVQTRDLIESLLKRIIELERKVA